MASLVNAGIVMSLEQWGDPIVIGIGWDGAGAADWLGYVDVYGATMSVTFGPHAGDFPASIEGPYAYTDPVFGEGQEVKLTQAWAVGTIPQTGAAFLINIPGPYTGYFQVNLFDDNLGYDTPAASLYIPEPTTLAILGLGAILLRRKS